MPAAPRSRVGAVARRALKVAAGEITEDEIHAAVVHACRKAGIAVHHSPNEGRHEVQYRAKLARLGVSPGWPDLVVMRPGHTGALELKRPGGRVSPEQVAWGERMNAAGWSWAVAYGVEDALETLRTWGYQV
jgi:hypothetical protein